MTPTRKRRLTYTLLILIGVGIATAIALAAFRQNVMFFYSPTEVMQGESPTDRVFRIGGLVAENSLRQEEEGLAVRFVLTDNRHDVEVAFRGILPDLFREGQGVVAHGRMEDGVFRASEVLAKHDENYMPPEVHDTLKASAVATEEERP